MDPMLIRLPMIDANIFSGTGHVVLEEAVKAPSRPVTVPVTDDDLDAYVSGLRQLTKRKRDLRPAIDAVQEDLDEVCGKIASMSRFSDSMTTFFDGFPQELGTADILAIQTRLKRATKVEIDRYLVTAQHTKDELLDRRAELTRSLVSMNEAGIVAGSETVPKNACPVCLTNAIELAFDPCGHTFCTGCSAHSHIYHTACPMCRTPVNKRIKVYFSL